MGVRLRGKITPGLATIGKEKPSAMVHVGIKDIGQHVKTIEAALAKHPAKGLWDPVERVPPLTAISNDVKIGDLPKHRATIVAAIGKYPAKRAQALVTVLSREYGLNVKWKALLTYVRREGLWTSPPSTVVTGSAAALSSMAASPSAPAPPIPVALISDLPLYRDAILIAIRDNPGKREKFLARALLERYMVCRVHWATLKDYIKHERLYDVVGTPAGDDAIRRSHFVNFYDMGYAR